MSVPGHAERESTAWLDPARLSRRAPAARRRWRERRAALHEALDAHARRTGIPVSPSRRADRAARSVRLGARRRVAGGQGRVPLRRRGLLVGPAASLRAIRHDGHRGAHRRASRRSSTRRAALVCDSGHAGDRAHLRRADDAGRPRGADAAGLQQDADVSRVARRPRSAAR